MVSSRLSVELRQRLQLALLSLSDAGVESIAKLPYPLPELCPAPAALKAEVLAIMDIQGFQLPLEDKLMEVLGVLASCASVTLAARDEDGRGLVAELPLEPDVAAAK